MLAGTSTYRDSHLHALPAVIGNLKALRELLEAIGLPSGQVCTVANPDQAIDISRELRHAAEAATDVLLFYYSGHGLLDEIQRLHLSLSSSDLEFVSETAMPFNRVRQIVSQSSAATRVVILDCCFSGRALENAMASPEMTIEASIGVEGSYTITSSSRNAASIARPGANLTEFTKQLIDVVGRGVTGAPKELTLRRLDAELQRRLISAGLPRSRSRTDDAAGELVIAANPASRVATASGPRPTSDHPTYTRKSSRHAADAASVDLSPLEMTHHPETCARNPATGAAVVVPPTTTLRLPSNSAGEIAKWLSRSGTRVEKGAPLLILNVSTGAGMTTAVTFAAPADGVLRRLRKPHTAVTSRMRLANLVIDGRQVPQGRIRPPAKLPFAGAEAVGVNLSPLEMTHHPERSARNPATGAAVILPQPRRCGCLPTLRARSPSG